MTPDVSVLLTVRGTPAGLLELAARSVLAQTHRRLELLIVADGPVDPASADLLDDLARDDRVQVLAPGRIGRARALNVALDGASGELVAIQDADDASHPRRLDRQVAAFAAQPDLTLLGTAAIETTSSSRTADWPDPPAGALVEVGRSLVWRNPLVHSSVMARRDVLRSLDGYDPGRDRHYDYDLYLRLRRGGRRMARLDEPLVLKRRHAAQSYETPDQRRQRAWGALRMQLDQALREPAPVRYGYVGLVTVRQIGHYLTTAVGAHRGARRVDVDGRP